MTESSSRTSGWPLHYQILLAMLIGTVIGVAINPGAINLQDSIVLKVSRATEAIILDEVLADPGSEQLVLMHREFRSDADFRRSFPRLSERLGEQKQLELPVTGSQVRILYEISGVNILWQRLHDQVPAVSQLSSTSADLLPPYWRDLAEKHPAGMGSRVISIVKFIGDLFLRLLKMVTVPLIMTSLITGVAGLGQHGGFGRMFSRTLLYYFVTSLLAIVTGIILVNLIQPGAGAILPGGGRAIQAPSGTLGEILIAQVLRLIPTNPFQAMAEGEFLSIISFSILFGLFINAVGGDYGMQLSGLFSAAFHVMMKMTSWIISLAPIGVGAFMIYATATQGIEVFGTLAKYMVTVLLALIIHAMITLPIFVRLFAKRSPYRFAQAMSPSLLTAFSTASSNAALPLTMSCVEERAGVSNRTSSFVLPLGATINMDGTALYEAVAVLFIAQATPGFELTIVQQITVALTALLASVGAAGIPHAGLVMMAIVLQAVGLPLEAQGIIIAVDRILDMCRTTVNVWSDACGCAVIDTVMSKSMRRAG
jgi:Na+/H+-dicarboxylate symporter